MAEFYRRIKKQYEDKNSPISYIAVPERTKKGRIHLHVLLYNLPPQYAETERHTRNLQGQYRRGYLDIRLATDKNPKIAGYMAKYLSKSMSDPDVETFRFYNTSRNIQKVTSFGYNQDDNIKDLVELYKPDKFVDQYEYDTIHLGKCIKTITKI
jgi:hypothetical protein